MVLMVRKALVYDCIPEPPVLLRYLAAQGVRVERRWLTYMIRSPMISIRVFLTCSHTEVQKADRTGLRTVASPTLARQAVFWVQLS